MSIASRIKLAVFPGRAIVATPGGLPDWKAMTWLALRVLFWLVLAGLAVTAMYGGIRSVAFGVRSLLWGGGLTSAGMLIGFLFGLPRLTLSTGASPTPAASGGASGAGGNAGASGSPPVGARGSGGAGAQGHQPDAMLEIADWLTKIIVGLGLVNLNSIPGLLDRLAKSIAGGASRRDGTVGLLLIPPGLQLQWSGQPSDESFGLAIAVFFPIAGLMLGYLMTRLFLQTALLFGDRQAREATEPPPVTALIRAYLENESEAQRISGGKGLPVDGPAPDAVTAMELSALNDQYVSVTIPDYSQRVRAKNELVRRMYDLAVKRQVPKRWLAAQPSDGYIHVLASTVLADPTPDDVKSLLRIGGLGHMKHVKFQVTLAFQKLIEASLVAPEEVPQIEALLTSYLNDADPPLRSLIELVRTRLRAP